MERYFLFGFDDYYPSGGMNDFIGDFETVEDAHTGFLNHERSPPYEHFQIYDTEEKKIVVTSEATGSVHADDTSGSG